MSYRLRKKRFVVGLVDGLDEYKASDAMLSKEEKQSLQALFGQGFPVPHYGIRIISS